MDLHSTHLTVEFEFDTGQSTTYPSFTLRYFELSEKKSKHANSKVTENTGVDQGKTKNGAGDLPALPGRVPGTPLNWPETRHTPLTSPLIHVQAQRNGFSTVSKKEEGRGKLRRVRC